MRRALWTVVDHGLATRHELRTTMGIEDYIEATEYIRAKQDAEQKAHTEAQNKAELKRR